MASNIRLVLLFLKFQNIRDFNNLVCFSFCCLLRTETCLFSIIFKRVWSLAILHLIKLLWIFQAIKLLIAYGRLVLFWFRRLKFFCLPIILYVARGLHENRVKFPAAEKCICSWPPTRQPWRHVQNSNNVKTARYFFKKLIFSRLTVFLRLLSFKIIDSSLSEISWLQVRASHYSGPLSLFHFHVNKQCIWNLQKC